MFLPVFDQSSSLLCPEIQRMVLQVNRAHRLFIFTPQECQYVRDRKKVLLIYRQYLENNQPIPEEVHSFFCINKELEQRVLEKEYLYKWRKQHQQSLTNDQVWQKLIQSSAHKPKTKALQIHWRNHGALSRWNHQAILYVAMDLLPKLIKYHENELLRCENNESLLPLITETYQTYLKDFLYQAEKLKILIAESMFARLRSMVVNQFQNADITNELILQLQAFGSLSTAIKLPAESAFEMITPKQFSVFHGYLSQEHPQKIKEKMQTLNWLVDQTQLATIFQKKSGRVFLVPMDLIKYIPHKKRWPASLFRGHNFRRKFFKDKEILLASLMTPTKHKDSFYLNNIEKTLDCCVGKEKEINDSIQSLCTQQHFYRSFWHIKTKRFLQTWRNWLVVQRERVMSEKLYYLENIINDLQQQSKMGVNNLILPWERSQWLDGVLQQLQENINDYQLSEEMISRIKKIKHSLSEVLLMNKAYQLIKVMANGELIKQADLVFLRNFNQVTRLYSQQTSQAFRDLVAPLIKNIYERFKKELSDFCFKDKTSRALKKHCDSILCFNYIIEGEGSEQQKESIKKNLIMYGLRYLEGLLQSATIVLSEEYEIVETIIILLGKKIMYGSKTISSFIEEIKELRKKAESGVLVAKCKSLILLLNHDLLKKRLAKELMFLDEGIAKILKNDPNLNYSNSNIDTIFCIRDLMIENEVSDVEKIGCLMPKHQQIISGIDCTQTHKVKSLLKISAKAHRVFNQIKSEKMSILEKHTKIQNLSHSVEKIFCEEPEIRSSLNKNVPFFKKRDFLNKRYIDENISHTLTR